ncbi:hypothetical protein HYV64_04115 [Candidatus Shapirobacteria bacterium]|nr:hypothetical protein [Candidatus Shapirobacteria bacterium]
MTNKNLYPQETSPEMTFALFSQDLKSQSLRAFNDKAYDFFHTAVEHRFMLTDPEKIRAGINNLVDIANKDPESPLKFDIYNALAEYYAEHVENNDSVDFKVQYHLYSILGPEPFVNNSGVPLLNGQLMNCTNFDFILDMRREKIKQLTQEKPVERSPKKISQKKFETITNLIGHPPEFDDSDAKFTPQDIRHVAKEAAKRYGITDSTEFDICPQHYVDSAVRAACEDTYRFAYDNITWADEGALLAVAEIQLMALSQDGLALDVKLGAMNNLVTLFKSKYNDNISEIIFKPPLPTSNPMIAQQELKKSIVGL